MDSKRYVCQHPGRTASRGPKTLTLYFVVCPLFAMADIDKVKTGLGLRKSQREIFEVALASQTAVPAHGLAEAGQVGIHFCNNFDIVGMAAALLKDGGPQGVSCFLAAINALPDESFFELKIGY